MTLHADQDHPRVCGKNSMRTVLMSIHGGSPPRVREKHPFSFRSVYGLRITPACAGKTLLGTRKGRGVKDHPRVCGKNPLLATHF